MITIELLIKRRAIVIPIIALILQGTVAGMRYLLPSQPTSQFPLCKSGVTVGLHDHCIWSFYL